MINSLAIFEDPAQWSALAPDAGASTEIALTATTGRRGDIAALNLDVGQGLDHRIETSFGFVDLNGFDDLQLWIFCSAASDTNNGFVAEIGFGATNLSLDAPSNTWRRYLPVGRTNTWELVTVSIADFPDRVRNRCNQMRIRVATARSMTLKVAELAAVQNTPILDVETALFNLLDGGFELDGDPVPAVLDPDPVPAPPGQPHLRIRQLAASSGAERMRTGPRRTDFTNTGFLERPPVEPLDLDYAIDAVGSTRAEQQALADFLLTTVPQFGTIEVNGAPATLEWNGPLVSRGDPPVPSIPLRVTVPRPADFPRLPGLRAVSDIEITVGQA